MNERGRQLLLGINKIIKTYSLSNATQGLQPISHKKLQDTKTTQLQAPKWILDDVDPNTNMVMMFSSSPPIQPR